MVDPYEYDVLPGGRADRFPPVSLFTVGDRSASQVSLEDMNSRIPGVCSGSDGRFSSSRGGPRLGNSSIRLSIAPPSGGAVELFCREFIGSHSLVCLGPGGGDFQLSPSGGG